MARRVATRSRGVRLIVLALVALGLAVPAVALADTWLNNYSMGHLEPEKIYPGENQPLYRTSTQKQSGSAGSQACTNAKRPNGERGVYRCVGAVGAVAQHDWCGCYQRKGLALVDCPGCGGGATIRADEYW